MKGEPSNNGNTTAVVEDIVIAFVANSSYVCFRDVDSSFRFGFICERSLSSGIRTSMTPTTVCYDGFQAMFGKCYYAYISPNTSTQAFSYCFTFGGSLMNIKNDAERDFLLSKYSTTGSTILVSI